MKIKSLLIFVFCVVALFGHDLDGTINTQTITNKGDVLILKTYELPHHHKLFTQHNGTHIVFAGVLEGAPKTCLFNHQEGNGDYLHEGFLSCGSYEFIFKEGQIYYQNKLLPILDEMDLQMQEVTYRYATNLENPSQISMGFYCSANGHLQGILNRIYDQEFGCENGFGIFSEKIKRSMDAYLQSHQPSNNQNNYLAQYLIQFPLEEITKDELTYYDDRLYVFERYTYISTNPEHGVPSQWSMIITKEGKKIDCNDFIDIHSQALKEQLWKQYQAFIKQYEYEIFSSYENFKVSSMISLGYDGIHFIYQPGEIMNYVYGVITLSLPFEVIKPYLKQQSAVDYLFK